jgi:pyruvate/2-oxoglutarate/acetoin dehydrogenase E1 component
MRSGGPCEALAAAERLAEHGVEAEVIDLRTLRPLDRETIGDSVGRTGRLVVVEEAPPQGGYAAEVVAVAAEGSGPVQARRVTMPDIPIPFAPSLEKAALPGEEDVVAAARALLD